ncbi:MAG: hypothetical protein M3094_10695, partial [Actinomycetia bacterium]|nr:hypothetical protein [Actinomycetes bacterium]
MQGDDRNDPIDDLFEPFELGEPPSDGSVPPPAQPAAETPSDQDATGEVPTQQHVTTSTEQPTDIACPACGARNPSFNHH